MGNTSNYRTMTVRQLLFTVGSLIGLCFGGGLVLAAAAVPLVASTGTASNALVKIFDDVPTNIDFTQPSQQSIIRTSEGKEIARFYAENRIVVASKDISRYIKDAAVSIEDERFYKHKGIDVQGILGATLKNITGGNLAGGSSITQQYVKNALIEEGRISNDEEKISAATERSLTRKLNEARYAIALERKRSKDEILTAYLNIAQFGPSQWGVEAASRYFYSVPAKDVTLEQAAMLAGSTQSPNQWNPITNPKQAKSRRDVVLSQMYRLGYITKEQRDKAIAVPIEKMLKVSHSLNGCESAGASAFFCETVVDDLLSSKSWGKDRNDRVNKLYRGGLDITTTLNDRAQSEAYNSLTKNVPVDDPSHVDGAVTSVEPGSGKIVAMVQNRNYGRQTKDRPHYTQLNLSVGRDQGGGEGFQPGSTFKMFTLVEWLKQGHSPMDRVNTTPRPFMKKDFTASCGDQYNLPPGQMWKPKNSEGSGGGLRTVTETTKNSYNVGYVEMASKLDLCEIAKTARALGARGGDLASEKDVRNLPNLDVKPGQPMPFIPKPAMVLGTTNVTPLSMANAAATLAANGKQCKPISFTLIKDVKGKVLAKQEPQCTQALDAEIAKKANNTLQQVVISGSGVAANLGRPTAGKTGTTNNAANSWFVGYTPDFASAVWLGHMGSTKPMLHIRINGRYFETVYGSTLPAQIFGAYGRAYLQGTQPRPFDLPTTGPAQNTGKNESDAEEGAGQNPDAGEAQNVIGMDFRSAANRLYTAGFREVYRQYAPSDTVAKNRVISAEPYKNGILLTVSSGSAAPPPQ